MMPSRETHCQQAEGIAFLFFPVSGEKSPILISPFNFSDRDKEFRDKRLPLIIPSFIKFLLFNLIDPLASFLINSFFERDIKNMGIRSLLWKEDLSFVFL